MPCRPLSSSFRASDMAAITERGEASPLYRLMLIVIVAVAIRKRASFLGRLENRWSPPRQDGSMCKKKKNGTERHSSPLFVRLMDWDCRL